jgi:hypothetical protein
MASFSLSPDLYVFNGMKVFTNLDEKHPEWPWVCFPQPLNPITFKTASNDPNRQMAFLSLNMWPLSENYKNAIRRSAMEKGDSNPRIPTHELCFNFPVEYIKQVAKSFPKLVEQVKEQFKETDPDIVNQDPTDENTHLFKAIRNRMNKRIALVYQPQLHQQPSPYAQQNYAAASAATGYVAPTEENTEPFAGNTYNEEDDLPF